MRVITFLRTNLSSRDIKQPFHIVSWAPDKGYIESTRVLHRFDSKVQTLEYAKDDPDLDPVIMLPSFKSLGIGYRDMSRNIFVRQYLDKAAIRGLFDGLVCSNSDPSSKPCKPEPTISLLSDILEKQLPDGKTVGEYGKADIRQIYTEYYCHGYLLGQRKEHT